MSSSSGRKKWTCPGCGRSFSIPVAASLKICPDCNKRTNPPAGTSPANTPTRLPSFEFQEWEEKSIPLRIKKKTVRNKVISVVVGGLLFLFAIFVAVVLMDNQIPLDQKIRRIVEPVSNSLSGLFRVLFSVTFIVLLFAVYFFPSIIASRRTHKNFWPIAIINVAGGLYFLSLCFPLVMEHYLEIRLLPQPVWAVLFLILVEKNIFSVAFLGWTGAMVWASISTTKD